VKLLPPLFDEPAPRPHDDGDRGAVASPKAPANHAGNRATRRPGMLARDRSNRTTLAGRAAVHARQVGKSARRSLLLRERRSNRSDVAGPRGVMQCPESLRNKQSRLARADSEAGAEPGKT
jgi:hypothetical protein